MASVTSLDKDLRRLRLDKYTPTAANEARLWIEGALGEALSSSDLLDGLKDGVALCRLVNLATGPPGVKFKKSAMPFVQMENISHFLRACQSPPLSMQDHDMFLTVDLFEKKDPAQVLQCLGAFSRAAHAANPSAFPSPMGPRLLSPQDTGRSTGGTTPSRNRGVSNVSSTSGRLSPNRSPTSSDRPSSPSAVSTWSKKGHEGVTSPAWNIAQYGYMGGASQGNLGIVYGGRRQITGAGPYVPSVRERQRKEQEAEASRQKQQMEEEGQRRKVNLEANEEKSRLEEEHNRDVETAQTRAEEKRKAEEEKRRWQEEERQWKLTEEKRRQEEDEAEARLMEERRQAKTQSEARLQGQYQTEKGLTPQGTGTNAYIDRIRHLEKDLESAREREKHYEEERSRRSPYKRAESKSRQRSRTRPPSRQDSWSRNDREVLHTPDSNQGDAPRGRNRPVSPRDRNASAPREHNPAVASRPLPVPQATPARSSPLRPQRTGESRPLPVPGQFNGRASTPSPASEIPRRPLPNPTARTPSPSPRLPKSPASPASSSVKQAVAAANAVGAKTNATPSPPPPGHPKRPSTSFSSPRTLLEREMELERQRQREWEEQQAETAASPRAPEGVEGVGGRWDVNQWTSYTGGDSQNRGSQGISVGASRRQIVGPRPLPSRP
ncbi:calponin [Diatrype stigma]|uniref:Calponin n=1 Tax=Diatrype stigma TaxID=117547 RepID=A0AAN9YUR0_9PEZI